MDQCLPFPTLLFDRGRKRRRGGGKGKFTKTKQKKTNKKKKRKENKEKRIERKEGRRKFDFTIFLAPTITMCKATHRLLKATL